MFSNKKVTELETRLAEKTRENDRLRSRLFVLEQQIADMEAVANTTPPDCKRGSWCKACEFVRTYRVTGCYSGVIEPVYICGKGESCANFVPKERD